MHFRAIFWNAILRQYFASLILHVILFSDVLRSHGKCENRILSAKIDMLKDFVWCPGSGVVVDCVDS